jgi:hypothetical protein
MKDLVLNLLISYAHSVSAAENLINNVYEITVDSGAGLSKAREEGERLRANLRETLARNCSLRRTDFDILVARVFSDIERKKTEIEKEQKQVRERVKAYLGKQKELATSLKEQVAKFAEDSGKENLEAMLNDIKASFKEEGEKIFAALRDFQLHLETFCHEQGVLNDKLRRLVNRGKFLTIDDLRQLEAAKDREQRKADRKARREDIERLLARFRQERQGA